MTQAGKDETQQAQCHLRLASLRTREQRHDSQNSVRVDSSLCLRAGAKIELSLVLQQVQQGAGCLERDSARLERMIVMLGHRLPVAQLGNANEAAAAAFYR